MGHVTFTTQFRVVCHPKANICYGLWPNVLYLKILVQPFQRYEETSKM